MAGVVVCKMSKKGKLEIFLGWPSLIALEFFLSHNGSCKFMMPICVQVKNGVWCAPFAKTVPFMKKAQKG